MHDVVRSTRLCGEVKSVVEKAKSVIVATVLHSGHREEESVIDVASVWLIRPCGKMGVVVDVTARH